MSVVFVNKVMSEVSSYKDTLTEVHKIVSLYLEVSIISKVQKEHFE